MFTFETIDVKTLHLKGEFVENDLGVANNPDGSVTVRMVAQQYMFVPQCVKVPIGTPVHFRLTGLALPLPELTTPKLASLIDEVLTNGIYRKNAQAMKRAIAKTNGLEKAADLLEEAFQLSRETARMMTVNRMDDALCPRY
jgi:hypothetical protein